MQERTHGWINLPDPAHSYCTRIYKGQGFAYNTSQIRQAAQSKLEKQGISMNGSFPVFVINGTGEVGLATADGLSFVSTTGLQDLTQSNAMPFRPLAHELLHTAGPSHTSSIESCGSSVGPTTFSDAGIERDCAITRYGVGIMGGGSQYLGTSAWHRHQLGILGIQRMGTSSTGRLQPS